MSTRWARLAVMNWGGETNKKLNDNSYALRPTLCPSLLPFDQQRRVGTSDKSLALFAASCLEPPFHRECLRQDRQNRRA